MVYREWFLRPHWPLALPVNRDLVYNGHRWLDEDVCRKWSLGRWDVDGLKHWDANIA